MSYYRVVIMYYRKLDDIPSIPEHIKLACIATAKNTLTNHNSSYIWYNNLETVDKNSVAYFDQRNQSQEFLQSDNNELGKIGFCGLSAELNAQIYNFYEKINHPMIKNGVFRIQISVAGNFIAPHFDPPALRDNGIIYLLDAGGPDVRTKWYEVKAEFNHLKLPSATGIPYSKLDVAADHRLEEDTWHWMNFSKIHSVENQKSLRIALWALPVL